VPSTDLSVLGPVLVRGPDGEVSPGGIRIRELLVALCLARGRSISPRALADELWWDQEGVLVDQRAALQTLVSRARRLVAPGLVVSGPAGYAFTGASDLDHARSALAAAPERLASGDAGDALSVVRPALALWRGDPGSDLSAGSPLAGALAAEARRVRDGLEELQLTALAAAGQDAEAARLAGDRLAVRPADEAACLVYMTAAARLGHVNDALRAFATLREALADELGSDPGPDVVELHERLLRGWRPSDAPAPTDDLRRAELPVGAPRTAPEPSTGGVAPLAVGLRVAPNALVGRDDDVAALERALRASRLVTVLGPGGLGKTRVAQEVARRASDAGMPVAVVELATVRTDADVELAIATTLGVRDVQSSQRLGDQLPRPDTRGRILDRLRGNGTLLVLDNCEHVLDGAARWVADVLAETRAHVLTTSRAALALAAESVYPLPSLASRGASRDGPAVVLFEQRARAARPDAPLPRETVVRLCDRLDGLPLAIELAAARVRSMSVAEIERRLASRFALLSSGDRSAPERHRTLRAVIDWSWNLLTTQEQDLLRRMSVFPGTFGAGAAEAVTAFVVGTPEVALTTVDDLDGLVSQSMLGVVDDPASGTTRFRMLETVREFGTLELERSGESEAVRDAVYAWAVAFARGRRGRLVGREQVGTIRRVRAEQDNLVQVLRWALGDSRRDVLAPVFALLARYWLLRGQLSEIVTFGFEVADAFVGHEPDAEDADELAWVYFAAGSPLGIMADYPRGFRSFARVRRLARSDLPLSADTRAILQLVATVAAPQEAPVLLARLRAEDDWVVAMDANVLSAQIAENSGDVVAATAYARRGYDIAVAHEDAWGVAMAAQSLAELAAESAQHEEALRWARVSRASLADFDAEPFMFQLDGLEANALIALGRPDDATGLLNRLGQVPDRGVPAGGVPAGDAPGAVLEEFLSASDRRIARLIGLAQATYGRGDVAGALVQASNVVDEMRRQGRAGMQGRVVQSSNRLAMAILEEEDARRAGRTPATPEDDREAWARDLRASLRGTLRATPDYVDRPVLGAASLALGGYLWTTPTVGRVDDGLELAALAARLGSRQDYVTLDRVAHRSAAVGRCGEATVRAAEDRASAAADPTARARELVEELPWRRPAG
jgi:predicted ATPase/DNA-binding SARP family transcriptional activator